MQNRRSMKRMQAGPFHGYAPNGARVQGLAALGRAIVARAVVTRVVVTGAVVIGAVALGTSSVYAQDGSFEQLTPTPEARTKLPVVQRVWGSEAEFQNAEALREFDSYFQDYLFPSMTLTSAEGLQELASHRGRLMRMLERPNYSQIHQRLTAMAFEAMQEIAVGNFHPASRYNAMLVIGSLDQEAGDPRDENNPPVPLPEAADFMIEQLQEETRAPDILKLGAMIGLERHVQYGLAEEKRSVLTDELIKVVTAPRPGERTVDFHAWLQFRAAQTLAQMKSLGEDNRIHIALTWLLNQDDVPITERLYVAKSLQLLKDQYTPEAGIDAAATVGAIGNVLADALDVEEDEAFKFNEQQRGGGFAFNELAALGKEPPGYPRGRLLQRLNYALEGFAAVENALTDELKEQVQAVRQPVEELRDAALERGTDVDLTIRIESMSDQIVSAANELGRDTEEASADVESDLSELGALE